MYQSHGWYGICFFSFIFENVQGHLGDPFWEETHTHTDKTLYFTKFKGIQKLRIWRFWPPKNRKRHKIYNLWELQLMAWVVPPPRNSGKWRFSSGSPTKNVILVVTGILGGGTTQLMSRFRRSAVYQIIKPQGASSQEPIHRLCIHSLPSFKFCQRLRSRPPFWTCLFFQFFQAINWWSNFGGVALPKTNSKSPWKQSRKLNLPTTNQGSLYHQLKHNNALL